ncbi:MAG: TonB-dependent receptor [Chromatiales bacterium]
MSQQQDEYAWASHLIMNASLKIHYLVLLLLLTGTCHSLRANHYDNLSVDYYFQDLPMVLSATRLTQPLMDIPAGVTLIDREMIQASGAMTIPDVLRLVPGMAVGFYSGSRATVAYQGLADEYARNMQVLVDGRSIYDPAFGGVSWPDMPIEISEIARIEVVRGPNAVSYGSNSYAGVINIITQQPADQIGTSVKTIVGGGETRKLYARHADQSGKFAYRLSADIQEYGGFDQIPDEESVRWVSFQGNYDPDKQNGIMVKLGASRGNYEEGFNEIVQKVRNLENRYHYEQIDWTHRFSPDNEITLQFYHNYFDIDDHFESPVLSDLIKGWDGWDDSVPVDIRPDLLAYVLSGGAYPDYSSFLTALNLTDSPLATTVLDFTSNRYDLELQQTMKLSDTSRLVWGLGLRQDSVESVWIFHREDRIKRNQARLFGNLEWHFRPYLVANLGGMVERFENIDPLFSPRLALNYHLNDNNTFRASASRAYRVPTLYEDYVQLVLFHKDPLDDLNNRHLSTEDLEPQQIDDYELGYLGHFPEQGLTLDVRLFYERLKNLIDEHRNKDIPDPDRGLTDPVALATLENLNDIILEGAFNFTNQADARIKGVEITLHYQPTSADLLYFGYSYQQAEGDQLLRIEDGISHYRDNVGDNVPDHTFSLLASHRFRNDFQISCTYYFLDNMNWLGEGDEVPSFNRWDLNLAQHFNFNNLQGVVSLYLQNIGDEDTDFFEDEDTGRINIWDRRAFLQATLNFH